MKLFTLLSLPVPIFSAVLIPQITPELVDGMPGWVAVLLLGVWVTLWFLDRVGRLPGQPDKKFWEEAESFSKSDRERLDKVYTLLAHRDDQDGIERFLKFLQESRISHKAMDDLVKLQSDTNIKLERLIQLLEKRTSGL